MKNKKFGNTVFYAATFCTLSGLASLSFAGQRSPSGKNSQVSYAVNMQDGGFILKEAGDSSLNVERTYRSRSLDHGFFGMGWCSDFESKILFQGRGVIRLVNCQSSRPSLFKVNQTASEYINTENPMDRILIKLGHYERQIQNRWTAKYSFRGELIELRKSKSTLKLMYNSRHLPEKILLNGKLISFDWHPLLDLIVKIKFENQTQILTYSGFNLIKAQKGKASIRYSYDDLDNLLARKVSSPSESISIEYDKTADKVLKIRGVCKEFYSYDKSSSRRTISTVSKSCHGQGSKKEFIFKYADDLDKPTEIKVSETALTQVERVSLNQGGEL